ncbi:1,2-phenylacetyl-CoA epoxidase subunit PaaC [Pontibacter sp. G13]|uniref:1,2-phenylacetyl-CoA epoxidase subunit PaaC n=1 Tax=Pontibacter sp. G13 TaxID=3074898 RepID=UPI0028899F6D|nr:1,2-phenylacetyl-CoA epoxidase subunit PaaC [Pontibacter sp. G13]WNJ20394.1 1,2-phenylacetyl-CoA epoxidase subunit PaaC [Pontibacter sp. G13]
MHTEAIKDLLYRIADDKLILGHRHSEWIGMGPILEEDIAFASMAQDEVGHSQAYYKLLEELGEGDPDQVAFNREETHFRCSHFVEVPNGDYAFSLVRHYLFEMADKIRLAHLKQSSYTPLAQLAAKIASEEKYHQLHAITFMQQLGNANEEANGKLQAALDVAFPLAFGLFEPTAMTESIALEGIQPLEDTLMKEWRQEVEPFLRSCNLNVPQPGDLTKVFGGRSGYHTEHLAPLLAEMTEVFAIDPTANW